MTTRRAPLRGVAIFAVVLSLGWLAWPLLHPGFTGGFQSLASVVLGSLEFGDGGHAEFLRTKRERRQGTDQDASWDASVRLSIDGVPKAHVIAINPRRLAYLPLLFFVAFLGALQLPARRTAEFLLTGAPILLSVALISVWIMFAWLFARVPGLVYDLTPWQSSLLHLSYEGFVTPIANKFILPLLLALGLVSLQARRARGAVAQESAVAPQPARGAATAPRSRVRRRRKR